MVRITASLGNGRLASFSFTVKVASEPIPTRKVTPSTSPTVLSAAVSGGTEVGGAGVSVAAGGMGVDVGGGDMGVVVAVGGAGVADGSGGGVEVGCAVAVAVGGASVGAGVDVGSSPQAATVRTSSADSATSRQVHPDTVRGFMTNDLHRG